LSPTAYNGLEEPAVWPPRTIHAGSDPLPVPYLAHPPRVIPIDIGRQLFVDDFLIEYTTLTRVFHTAQPHAAAPVLAPETELELNGGHCPLAGPFNDGAWYDPSDGTFKLWYHAGWFDGTALATSSDGLHWERPALDVVPGTNAVMARPPGHRRDGAAIWLDSAAAPASRYKMFVYWRWAEGRSGHMYASSDGVHFRDLGPTSACGDNTTFFYNPFRETFVFSIRQGWDQRARSYYEHEEFTAAGAWPAGAVRKWARVDRLDRPDPFLGNPPQLYDLNVVAYESLLLGAWAIYYGPENRVAAYLGKPKINDLQLGYSRDGFHWHRPDRRAFISCSRQWGAWDYGYIHAAGGVCLVVGDELWFYYAAFSGRSPLLAPGHTGIFAQDNAMYAGGHTGLATLRRDGFASMDGGTAEGVLATRLVTFSGSHLFVNIQTAGGEMRAEVLDEQGQVLAPFTRSRCRPLRTDATKVRVCWQGAEDLSRLQHRPVQFRFYLRSGRLFAFWVSPSPKGESRGYVAAGGPGLPGNRDL